MPRMLKEFRQFILRGNRVDLAVAVVISAAARRCAFCASEVVAA